jgi:recombination protein RecR
MTTLPPSLQQLIVAFGKLPGIGRKTAARLAFHILTNNKEEGEELARAIQRVKSEIKLCSRCFNFSERDLCAICADPKRSHKTICVLEDSQTILLIEKTNEYKGLYHILGGVISPLDGIGPEELHIKELLQRLEGIEEIILALSPSTEGEATSIYLSKLLKPQRIKITRLARGIPLGSSLEFVDELTLSKALQSRSEI